MGGSKIMVHAFFVAACHGIDNGKGHTPPMGWRSWNLYGANVNQKLMEGIMEGVVRKRDVDGTPMSLCDLGYCDVGLDDNWQSCGHHGTNRYTYHSDAGFPIVNEERFPDFKAMTTKAHSLGLTAGWYLNNCICEDHCGDGKDRKETDTKCYNGDAAALIEFGFDSVKLDGCGKQRDLDVWAGLFNASGRPIMIENCHWGQTVPNATWCPWNLYRTSGDVRASYGSIVANLQTTVKFATANLSKPGCWAYPDMMEVGCQHGPGGSHDPGLTDEETRAHFGAWCIVSSPLTISHDVNNESITERIWDVISNREAIAINQAYAGHSGSPFKQSERQVTHQWSERINRDGAIAAEGEEGTMRSRSSTTSAWQYFYKPVEWNGAKVAVLLMNHDKSPQDLVLNLESVPGLACGPKFDKTPCKVRDVWAKKDAGVFPAKYTAANLAGHDAAFLTIEPCPGC